MSRPNLSGPSAAKPSLMLLCSLIATFSLADLANAQNTDSTQTTGAASDRPDSGERRPDPDTVRGLLVEHCVACHEIPGISPAEHRATVDAPSFQRVAGDPERYPEARLRASLRQPHWPMQGFILSDYDIERILAFIARLRSHP